MHHDQLESIAGPSRPKGPHHIDIDDSDVDVDDTQSYHSDEHTDPADEQLGEGMDLEGFSGPSQKILKPLTPEALIAFKAAQEKAGIIYISRIPPGMRPAKVRHLMSAYGEVGRVYLQQEGADFSKFFEGHVCVSSCQIVENIDPKRAYLRKKYTSTKKPHFTEGWAEFKDKRVARSVAEMLNAQSIGGKKGTRWRDDVWTMKYLPKFKWNMLTEQVAHEAQLHQAKLRVELSQSRIEQQEYLRNVELAKVLEKRAAKKKEKGEDFQLQERPPKRVKTSSNNNDDGSKQKKRRTEDGQLESVLGSVF